MCVVTRQLVHRSKLWRVVRVGPGMVELDTGQGRSAYVVRTVDAVRLARTKNKIGRALRTNVPPHIYDELERRALKMQEREPEARLDSVCDINEGNATTQIFSVTKPIIDVYV
jgi:uncharacterized protein